MVEFIIYAAIMCIFSAKFWFLVRPSVTLKKHSEVSAHLQNNIFNHSWWLRSVFRGKKHCLKIWTHKCSSNCNIFRFLKNRWPFKNKPDPILPHKIERNAPLFKNCELLFQEEKDTWPMCFTCLLSAEWFAPESWQLCCNPSLQLLCNS